MALRSNMKILFPLSMSDELYKPCFTQNQLQLESWSFWSDALKQWCLSSTHAEVTWNIVTAFFSLFNKQEILCSHQCDRSLLSLGGLLGSRLLALLNFLESVLAFRESWQRGFNLKSKQAQKGQPWVMDHTGATNFGPTKPPIDKISDGWIRRTEEQAAPTFAMP